MAHGGVGVTYEDDLKRSIESVRQAAQYVTRKEIIIKPLVKDVTSAPRYIQTPAPVTVVRPPLYYEPPEAEAERELKERLHAEPLAMLDDEDFVEAWLDMADAGN